MHHQPSIVPLAACLLLTVASARAEAPDAWPEQGVEITAPAPNADPDARVGIAVKMALKGDPAWGRIGVAKVAQGVVWLHGTVTEEARLADALHVIERIDGVREIRSEVGVDSSVGPLP